MNLAHKILSLARCLKYAAANPKRTVGLLLAAADTRWRDHVAARHSCSEGLATVDLLDIFPGFAENVDPMAFLEGGSPALDLAMLKAFARRSPHCRYFEIGTWRGESVANVAAVAEECIALSLSDEQMRAAGWGEEFINTARVFSSSLPNVRHLGANSRDFDFRPYHGQCDLVFIDGDHSHDGVQADTENAFRLLRNQDSVIVWHDYMRSPERDIDWGVLAGILDGSPSEQRRHLYHLSNTLCAIYWPRDVRAVRTKFPARPNKIFALDIKARGLPNKV